MSLPAPPPFKHARGGASPFKAADTSDMWAIDRSDNHHYYPLPHQHASSTNHTPSYTSRRLGGDVDTSWASTRGGGSDQFSVPMPPMPTDFPPPPPKGLVKSIVSSLEQPNKKRGTTTSTTSSSSRKGTAPVSTKQQMQRNTPTSRSNQPGGESWDYSAGHSHQQQRGGASADISTNNGDAADYQDLLVKYKKYVDDRIMPRLTKALESLSTTETKLQAVTSQLADTNEEKQSLKGSVQQLRSLLDQERVITSRDHNERLQLIKQNMESERADLEARLKVAERVAQSQSTSSGRVAELERTLELRDMEIRNLKQQHQAKSSEDGGIGIRPSSSSNSGVGGGGDGLNEAESMDRVLAEMESLISESISFGRAFEESSSNAGLNADYSPSVVWNAVSVAAGLEDDHHYAVHFDSSRMCNSIAAIRKSMKSERAAVSTSLGQLAASHAELLESIGNREHEMWRVKDMHQQRLEDLERDFNEQLQNLNAQLQYQTQYGASAGGGAVHGFGGPSHSSPSGANGRGSNVTFTDLSPLTVGAGSPTHHGDHYDDDNGGGSQPRSGRRHVVTANTASQTNLELSLLFPGTSGGGSSGTPGSSPADFSSSRSKGMPTPNGANVGDAALDADLLGLMGSGGGPQAVQSMNRLVAELKLLQDETVRLKDEVRRLRDERHKYLGFMRMGSEGVSTSMAGFGTSNHRIDIGNTKIQKSTLLGGSTTGLLLS